MKKLASLLLLLCLAPLVLTGCGGAEAEYGRYTMTFFGTFDTMMTIIGFAQEEATFAAVTEEAKARFTRYHEVYDGYLPHDGVKGLYYMNREAPKGPVQVEQELMDLLLYCKEMQPQFDGLVNVALGAVLRHWHDFRESAEVDPATPLPDMDTLREAALHTDFDQVLLDPETNTVTYLDPKLSIDLGSVAKGYAAQQVGEWMLEGSMPSFIISAGGNIVAGDAPLDGRLRWGVSVQDPDGLALGNPNGDNMEVLYLRNLSVVTSGDYQRYVVVDGVRIHHIVSPETLMPTSHMRAVTLVAEDSGYADLLSTAVFLLPYEEGRAMVDALPGVEALWILNDRTVMMTDGMAAMAKSQGATSK